MDWQYEQEYRLIVELSITEKRAIENQVMYLFEIEPELLKSVTIGLRTSAATADEILALVDKVPLKHLQVFKIVADENEFKLHRKRIK